MAEVYATLRDIPPIDRLVLALENELPFASIRREALVAIAREIVNEMRAMLKQGQPVDCTIPALVSVARQRLQEIERPSLRKVVNATGVVLHTNLGRAPLGKRARAALEEVISGYSTLEYDVASGQRGSRYAHVTKRICALTGAEDAIVVNNNAAAVLLVLSAMAKNKEVIVSRGQLVEIGGSFRVPDVLKHSGATLVEIGSTNKTHLSDYEKAITECTAMILKVHTSNYRIIGFTAQPEIEELVNLAHKHELPIVEDLGSGTLLPIAVGGLHEPTVAQSLAAGIDIVTFSGDKLLGAGQAGIIAGKKQYIDAMKKHPLLRAIRIDKLSLAALEGTLIEYILGEARVTIPVQYMLHRREEELQEEARELAAILSCLHEEEWFAQVINLESQAGGGAMPGVGLASFGVSVTCKKYSAGEVEKRLRQRDIPIVARIQDDKIIFDMRCLVEGDIELIRAACLELGKGEK